MLAVFRFIMMLLRLSHFHPPALDVSHFVTYASLTSNLPVRKHPRSDLPTLRSHPEMPMPMHKAVKP